MLSFISWHAECISNGMNNNILPNTLKYIALLSVAGASVATAAETAGINVSSTWGYQLPFIAFTAALVLLTVVTDYSRSLRSSFEPQTSKAVMLPANQVFGSVATVAPARPIRRIRRVRHQLVHR